MAKLALPVKASFDAPELGKLIELSYGANQPNLAGTAQKQNPQRQNRRRFTR